RETSTRYLLDENPHSPEAAIAIPILVIVQLGRRGLPLESLPADWTQGSVNYPHVCLPAAASRCRPPGAERAREVSRGLTIARLCDFYDVPGFKWEGGVLDMLDALADEGLDAWSSAAT